jgi:GNAT superfamily N-acetyltransferase
MGFTTLTKTTRLPTKGMSTRNGELLKTTTDVVIEQLREEDLGEAERILCLAFGTFLGLPDPIQMFRDRQAIANRWRANPSAVFGAYLDGKLVGSNVAAKWGTFGWFGPLTVRPDLWGKGIAKRLLGPTMDLFSKWQTTHEGLFTFAHSPKHIGLYQKFGFYPRFLTSIMSKKVEPQNSEPKKRVEFNTFSSFDSNRDREGILSECRELTNGLYDGLDLSDEIKSVQSLKLGDTVLVKAESRIIGFAVCHVGTNTEAGRGRCYVKFGLAESKSNAKEKFRDLFMACEAFASRSGVETVDAGVNLGRSEAYREMLSHGFCTDFLGVAMQRPNEPGFNRPDVFAIDDWR